MPRYERRPASEPGKSLQRTVDETSKGGGVVKSYPISKPEGHGWHSNENWTGNNPEDNRI